MMIRNLNLDHMSKFDIQNPILTLNSGRIWYFDIRNTILTFEFGPNIEFYIRIPNSLFELGPNIKRIRTEYRILTIEFGNYGCAPYLQE